MPPLLYLLSCRQGVRCRPPLFQRRDGSSSFSHVEVRDPLLYLLDRREGGGWPPLHSFRQGERALVHSKGDGGVNMIKSLNIIKSKRCLPLLFQRMDGSSSFSLVEVPGPSSRPPCSQRRRELAFPPLCQRWRKGSLS